jgi:hypothetical protein
VNYIYSIPTSNTEETTSFLPLGISYQVCQGH